jgi:hypothetical protein
VVNRRAARRFALSNLAQVECRKGAFGFGPNLLVRTLDISETGVRVVLKSHLDKGQAVEVVVKGTGRQHKRQAQVMWSLRLEDGNCCAGLRFDRPLPYGDVQRLAKPFH